MDHIFANINYPCFSLHKNSIFRRIFKKIGMFLHEDILIDVFRFSNRFDINQRFEHVNRYWASCIAKTETFHLPLYKLHKLWICPLFCALHYKMKPAADVLLRNIFSDCTESCREKYIQFISDDWPAQRIPFCMYIQKSKLEPMQLKRLTFNYDNWRIERPENGHFFLHFKDVCFDEAYLDVYNDRSLTLFLLDCPIFNLRTSHFAIRTSTEPLPFQRVTEFSMQKVMMPKSKKSKSKSSYEMPAEEMTSDNPFFAFIQSGKEHCSELTLESQEFTMLFELVDLYKNASDLSRAIPVVKLTVPPYNWHQRPFVEGTLYQLFHTSEQISPLIHHFAFFDAESIFEKFACNVHFFEGDEDKIQHYEFLVQEMN